MNFQNPYSKTEYKKFFQDNFLTDNFHIIEEELSLEFKPQFIKKAELIGRDKSLELEVYEIQHESENDPRVGLSKDFFRLMANYGSKRALAIFYSSKSKNYRLSLATVDLSLEGSRIKREYSNPRRFSFFLGPDAKIKTPYEFLIKKGRLKDFEDLRKRFSIDAVTDEFYNAFKPNFDLISASVKGTKDEDLKKDFALLFIIRIIFLGFVQKKLWLNKDEDFLLNFWKEYKSKYFGKNLFYSEWLTPLFFESLNNPPGRKVFNRSTQFSESTALALQMAPFLNGELFKEKKGYDDCELFIPDKNIEQFFDFLFSYNFTIEENTLYDQDLELNPEFLGIIFERLVNKEDGAVYTPRTEVDFMCRISLVKWLEKNSYISKKKLYHLFFDKQNDNSKEEILNSQEKEQILALLKNVTICDPAAGSGAFPVGMLQVLDEIIHSLTENDSTNIFERKKEIISRSLYGVEVKHWAVWINQLRLWLSLFVDMPDEFKSSFEPLLPNLEFKIRRGDSLVQQIGNKLFPVDSHANISSDLKRKITELKKEKSQFFYGKSKLNAELIRKKESDIFKAIIEEQILEKKKTLRVFGKTEANKDIFGNVSQEEELRLHIDEKKQEQIKEEIKTLEDELRSFKDEHPLVWNIEFAEIFYDKGGFDIIIGNPPYIRQEKISDPNGKYSAADYKELLRQTIYEEYPDYFYANKQKSKLKVKIDGKSDLYTFFYLKSLKLLNENGIHTFICSNSWLDVGYGKWLQQFILENARLHFVVDNHAKRSFASADVNTIITILDAPTISPLYQRGDKEGFKVKFIVYKRPFDEVLNTENLLLIEYAETITKDEDFRVYPITYKELKEAGTVYEDENDKKLGNGIYEGDKWGGKYLRAPDIFFTILEKGKDKLVRLGDIAEVRRGFTTGANEFFYLTEEKIKQWGIEEEFLKPVLKSAKDNKKILIDKSGLKTKIFLCHKSKNEIKGTNALKYIEWGEKQEYHKIKSVQARALWYDVGIKIPADAIILRRIGERCPFFEANNVLEDCVLFGITLNSSSRNKILFLSSLNSTWTRFYIELMTRQLTGAQAVADTNVYIVNDARIVDPIKFTDDNQEKLKLIYKKFRERESKSIFEELGFDKTKPIRSQEPNPLPDRKALDDIIFDALGLTEAERKEVYWSVAELVKNRLDKAKSV